MKARKSAARSKKTLQPKPVLHRKSSARDIIRFCKRKRIYLWLNGDSDRIYCRPRKGSVMPLLIGLIKQERKALVSLLRSKHKTYKNKYESYIMSDEWQVRRNKRLEWDKFRCQQCGSSQQLQVHHLTYKRVFDEDILDLITLCKICHKDEHNVK